ncbi:MAG TPA: hypothetical protein VKS79_23380 [Gemmataceae bacterium]|nr:hypothetical protein [Gemmataceae bacterium]
MNTEAQIPLSKDDHVTAQWIWTNLVPKSGQCGTVQGELLRVVEKLSWEANNNGNVNWDNGFEILIDYFEQTVCGDPQISPSMKASVREDLNQLRDFERPCTGEEPYNRLTSAVVAYCRLHPHLLPKPANSSLRR